MFCKSGILSRVKLTAMHQNENVYRAIKINEDGGLRFRIVRKKMTNHSGQPNNESESKTIKTTSRRKSGKVSPTYEHCNMIKLQSGKRSRKRREAATHVTMKRKICIPLDVTLRSLVAEQGAKDTAYIKIHAAADYMSDLESVEE